MILTQRLITDPAAWSAVLAALPRPHLLQTWAWGDFKQATTGWIPTRITFYDRDRLIAAVSLGARRVGGLTVLYAPKGPLFAADVSLAQQSAVIAALEQIARQHRALWLKIDPDVIAGTGVPGEADDQPDADGAAFTARLTERGWRFSADQVQFRNTVVIDLTPPLDAILAGMNQSTRRKIRLAERDGVSIRPGTLADLPTLYDLYRVTGQRDGFLIRPFEYYQRAWRDFMTAGIAQPLIAEVDGQPVAHVILFHVGPTCWYIYGASGNDHRDKQPNYLLQWAAIQWAKARGCTRYDLWGAPDVFTEDDPLWGVYQFKRGLRGTVTRQIGAWDYAPFPPLYAAYTRLWPRVLSLLRRGR